METLKLVLFAIGMIVWWALALLERCDNDANAAQAYLSERLLSDGQLREALVKSAIEYERLEMIEAPS
jgi:hypothetical protein